MIKEMNREFNALPPDVAKHVRSMRVQNDWVQGPGLREQTQITFHRVYVPRARDTVGRPVTIYRPMSFLMDGDVHKDHIPTIKKRVREEHDKLDENHPLKQANFGVVSEGWHVDKEKRRQVVGTTLYKVKNQLSDSAEEDYQKVGDFEVNVGTGRNPSAKSISESTRHKFKTSGSVPVESTLEAPSPGLF